MRRVLGREHRATLATTSKLATALDSQGKHAQAEAIFKEVIEMRARAMGPEHPETLISMHGLAVTLGAMGSHSAAEDLFQKTLEIRRRVLGQEHPNTLHTLAVLAAQYQSSGNLAAAETHAAQALTARRRVLGKGHSQTRRSAADLALALQSQGKFTECEAVAREAIDADATREPDDLERLRAMALLGASLAGQKNYDAAEPLLVEAVRGLNRIVNRVGRSDRAHVQRSRDWIVALYRAWDKPAKAAEWLMP
jgi:tetratricopeptide (TPR) repeat protein